MVINLAHRLNISVVAEGIETVEQLQFLTEKNADFIQGFYFSEPLPAEQCQIILLTELQRHI
jgi:EAL domain-containing protein (putative c-di-GMP-specific phosphodiesterase class I)